MFKEISLLATACMYVAMYNVLTMKQKLCLLNFGIIVADFGLSEDIYKRNYFRQAQKGEDPPVKLPIKWMAMESLSDGIFCGSTDVVSIRTCWE